jgi:hypothetical protein
MPIACRLCGCTENRACIEVTHAGGCGCSWVPGDEDLCTACERAWAVLRELTCNGTALPLEALERGRVAAKAHRLELELRHFGCIAA